MKTKNNIGLDIEMISAVIESLNGLLADHQVFYTNLRGLHWNIKGDKFFELHELYETYYDETAEAIDAIAERIVMLGGHPENRFSLYLKQSSVKEISNVSDWTEGVNHVLEVFKMIIDKARELQTMAFKANDVGTASLAEHRIKSLEKKRWMLSSYLAD
jgi:starvation-inducible DNA-binding protein